MYVYHTTHVQSIVNWHAHIIAIIIMTNLKCGVGDTQTPGSMGFNLLLCGKPGY